MAPTAMDVWSKLLRFMGDLPVMTLPDLLSSNFNGDCVVPASFDTVIEGVDMWYTNYKSKEDTRFRVKMKVQDGEHVAVFTVFDEEVQKLATETCPLLLTMGESCSIYPYEMECFNCDVYLFKVEKREFQNVHGMPSFKVKSVCNEVDVVDMFFDEYPPEKQTILEEAGSSGLKDLIEGPMIYHSSCESKGNVSPEIVVGGVDLKNDVSLDAPVQHTNFIHKKKISETRMGLCVESVVCSRSTSNVRRKLCFDDIVVDNTKKNVDPISSGELKDEDI